MYQNSGKKIIIDRKGSTYGFVQPSVKASIQHGIHNLLCDNAFPECSNDWVELEVKHAAQWANLHLTVKECPYMIKARLHYIEHLPPMTVWRDRVRQTVRRFVPSLPSP